MQVEIFTFNTFLENTYMAWDPNTGQALIVDPGMMNQRETDRVDQFIQNHNLNPQAVLLTHAHVDHACGAQMFAQQYHIPIYGHSNEQLLASTMTEQSLMFGFGKKISNFQITDFVTHMQKIQLAGQQIQVLETAGHTQGGVCYYLPQSSILFAGDTIFYHSVGRTDFTGGSHSQLISNIRQHILTLPPHTVIYSGHGQPTTVEEEKNNNPFLN